MKRVLIAEDNPDLRTLLAQLMRDAPFETTFAATGLEAMSHYRTALSKGEPFDLLALDVAMPMRSGLAVLQEVRQSGDTQTRALFHTALLPVDVAEEAHRLSARVVYKPEASVLLKRYILEELSRANQ